MALKKPSSVFHFDAYSIPYAAQGIGKAVMVAIMLGAASLLGELSATSAFATHDPDATQVASKTISPAADGNMVIDTVEPTAKESNSRTSGTLTVAIVQDEEFLKSAEIDARSLNNLQRY